MAGGRLPHRTSEDTVTVPFLTRAHHASTLSLKFCLWSVLGYGGGLVVARRSWLSRFRRGGTLRARAAKAHFTVL